MKTLNNESTSRFMAQDPTILGAFKNQFGQLVVFLEHPTRGEDAPVYAFIEDVLANTGFYDLDDFMDLSGNNPTEYMPVLLNGKISCFDV